jgi:hypothetical protein
MSPLPRRPARRWIARLAVASGHVVVLLVVIHEQSLRGGLVRAEFLPRLLVRLLPAIEHPPEPSLPALGPPRLGVTRSRLAVAPPAPASADAGAPPAPAHTDWTAAAERIARAAAGATPATRSPCNERGEPRSSLPPCAKPARPFEWHPQPRRVEVDGLIPYVRVGKRCVVGLGFFGCAVGDLPAANGHLFDEMKQPDRPQGSVPDARR